MKRNNHHVEMICTPETFRPRYTKEVRWWHSEDWPEMHRKCRRLFHPGRPWKCKDWRDSYDRGWQYCCTIEKGHPTAMAGLWRRRLLRWDIVIVGSKEAFHRKSRDKALISLITQYILDSGRIARIIVNRHSRLARAAQSVGFWRA